MSTFTLACLATLFCVGLLLFAEWRESRRLRWLAKPLASTGFLVAAIAAGALDSRHGHLVLIALVFGMLGDVLLIPAASTAFLAGLASFLLGHVVFALAFLARGVDAPMLFGAAALLALPAALCWRWLAPHVPAKMRVAVIAYIGVISIMVAAAAGTLRRPGGGVILLGAVMFFLSDLAVARQRFVERTVYNKLWGLPLYYGGQLVLAGSVSIASAAG